MKSLISVLILIASVSTHASAALPRPASKDVVIGISEVYVPENTSSASDAQVVVSGMFPNSCYSWKHATVTNTTPLEHEVKSIAEVAQAMCLMVMVPFQKEVHLGKLISGSHTLRFMNGDGTYFERTMRIE